MADTTFIDDKTSVGQEWLNDVNRNSYGVASIAKLKLVNTADDGAICHVESYYGDGSGNGGGDFKWYASSTDTADDGMVVQATGVTTGRWKRIEEKITLKKFGAKGDYVHNPLTGTGAGTDDTASIQAAIDAGYVINDEEGNYRITSPLILTADTSIIGETIGGDHSGYKTVFYYDHSVTTNTLSAGITDSQTTLTLTDASSFPVGGGYIYLDDVNGEWCTYSGKSGNTLTGVNRGWDFVGDSALSTEIMGGTVEPTAYSSSTKVTLSEPLFQRIGIFRGTLKNIKCIKADYIFSQNVNEQPDGISWTDLGMAFYFDYGAYSRLINSCDFLGFEKVGFVGRSFVSTYDRFKSYYCRYGLHVLNGNGLNIQRTDTGLMGTSDSGIGAEIGWSFYLHKSRNTSLAYGNVSNGGYSDAIQIDNSPECNVRSIYIESCLGAPFEIKNGSVVRATDLYIKDATNFGKVNDTSEFVLNGLSYQDMTVLEYPNAISGFTGTFEVTDIYDIGTTSRKPNIYGNGTELYFIPIETDSKNTDLMRTTRGSKTVADNTVTDIFEFRNRVEASPNNQRIIGFKVEYIYYSDYTAGAWVTQKGEVQFIIRNENDLAAPYVAVSTPSSVDLTSTTITVTTTWNYRNDLVNATGDGTWDTVITFNADNSNNTSGTLLYHIVPMTSEIYDENGGDDLGYLTLL